MSKSGGTSQSSSATSGGLKNRAASVSAETGFSSGAVPTSDCAFMNGGHCPASHPAGVAGQRSGPGECQHLHRQRCERATAPVHPAGIADELSTPEIAGNVNGSTSIPATASPTMAAIRTRFIVIPTPIFYSQRGISQTHRARGAQISRRFALGDSRRSQADLPGRFSLKDYACFGCETRPSRANMRFATFPKRPNSILAPICPWGANAVTSPLGHHLRRPNHRIVEQLDRAGTSSSTKSRSSRE